MSEIKPSGFQNTLQNILRNKKKVKSIKPIGQIYTTIQGKDYLVVKLWIEKYLEDITRRREDMNFIFEW